MSVEGLYFTVTSGFFFLNPSRTAWNDLPSAPVQSARIVTVPLTLALVGAFLPALPRLAATSAAITATPTATATVALLLMNPLLSSLHRFPGPSPGRRNAALRCRPRSP